jgi:GntR family transcriptional regulator/MocR family aminotransferase
MSRPGFVNPLPIVLDRASATPLYRQVYEGYRAAIVERRLRPGDRLPSTRSLAAELGISRLPVVNAFEQLVAEGYCEGLVGSGTFVARSLSGETLASDASRSRPGKSPRPGERALSRTSARLLRTRAPWLGQFGPFRVGDVAIGEFPLKVWSQLLARAGRTLKPAQLRYGDAMGYRPLREAIAAYLRAARSARCEAEQVMIVSGSQQALTIAARVVVDPDSEVWVEEPGYWGVQNALVASNARLVPVPVDEEGLNVAQGIERAPRATAAFITPSRQLPLGTTMSAPRRMQLLDWARRSGSWIVEDDYDSELRYASFPIAALQGLDRDSRVIYVGTFSKVVFPSLRAAYLVIPADLVSRFVSVRRTLDICPPAFLQVVLADFMREGHFARHLRRMRQLYSERRRVLVECLDRELGERLRTVGEPAGTDLAVLLPRGMRDRPLSERAADEGLWLLPLSDRYLGRPTRQGFVLGYGGTSVEEIPAAARRLRALLDRSSALTYFRRPNFLPAGGLKVVQRTSKVALAETVIPRILFTMLGLHRNLTR